VALVTSAVGMLILHPGNAIASIGLRALAVTTPTTRPASLPQLLVTVFLTQVIPVLIALHLVVVLAEGEICCICLAQDSML